MSRLSKIAQIKQSLEEAIRSINYWKGRYEELQESKKEELDHIMLAMQKVERSSSQVKLESDRLWNLIELITVPADKMQELAKLKEERARRGY